MKKRVVFISLLLTSWLVLADMDIRQELQQRLSKITGFYGTFEQVVKTKEGKLIQEGKGQLWLRRPYFFNWQMKTPDEISIISDGKIVWMYTVMLEQVTAMNLKDVADNRLLVLITDNKNSAWQHYMVTNKGDCFILHPKNDYEQSFEIVINNKGILNSFTVIEEDGQQSFYQFSHQKLVNVPYEQFKFVLPDGVTVDDQR